MSVRSQRTGGLLLLDAQSVAAPRQTCQRVISVSGAAHAGSGKRDPRATSTSERAGATLLDATIYRSLRRRRWEGDDRAPGVRDAMRVLASAGIQAHRVIIRCACVRFNDPQPGLCAGMRGTSRSRGRRRRGETENMCSVLLHAPVSLLPPSHHLCVTTRGRARTYTHALSCNRHIDPTRSKQGTTSVRNEDGRFITGRSFISAFFFF